MNSGRVFTLAQRVMRQILRDHRTVALLFIAPILILTLGAVLFRAETPPIALGVVDKDEGIQILGRGTLSLGERMTAELRSSDSV